MERQGGIQQEGTGLGLAIAKKSEMLGGTISMASVVTEGTTFTLRIVDYEAMDGAQHVPDLTNTTSAEPATPLQSGG